jgi:hypothetical protein
MRGKEKGNDDRNGGEDRLHPRLGHKRLQDLLPRLSEALQSS